MMHLFKPQTIQDSEKVIAGHWATPSFRIITNTLALLITWLLTFFAIFPCGDGSNTLHFFITLSFDEQSMCGSFSFIAIGYALIMWSYIAYIPLLAFAMLRFVVHAYVDSSVQSHGDYLVWKKLLFTIRLIGTAIAIPAIIIFYSYISLTDAGYTFHEKQSWLWSALILD